MKIRLLFVLAVLFCAAVPLSSSVVTDIEEAIRIYSTNSARGLETLLSAYNANPDLQTFKSVLYERQNYQLYAELLARIPAGRETADEILQMNLILGKTASFPGDLSNYLKFYTPSSAAEKYPDLIVKNAACLDYLAAGYQPGLFLVLKNSHVRMKRFAQFDSFLARTGTNGGIPPLEVKNYLKESWPLSQRNVESVLLKFGLENDPEMLVFGAASSFLAGQYEKVLEIYPALRADLLRKETQYRALQVDLPFLFFYSLFRTARYRDALRDITRFYFPDRNDIAELRFLCCLGLGDAKKASEEISSMRRSSKILFYAGVLELRESPSNAVQNFEGYLEELDESQNYLPESMLVYYTMTKNPAQISSVLDLLNRSMLFQPLTAIREIPLSVPFVLRPSSDTIAKETPSVPSGRIASYLKFLKALDKKKSGDSDGAKKELFELIRSTNTSPMVRSMAVYQTRNQEQ